MLFSTTFQKHNITIIAAAVLYAKYHKGNQIKDDDMDGHVVHMEEVRRGNKI
jgi:hypothetical protein